MMLNRTTAAFAAFGAAALVATGAHAHAHLVKSNPAENATVAAPKQIHLEFSEKLEPKFSAAELTKTGGPAVAVASKAAGKTIHATPKAPLAPGAYTVIWHVVSKDGHKMKGQYAFTVK